MSQLGMTLATVEVAERRRAVRSLLRRPLVVRSLDRDAFTIIVRHQGWLQRWFAEQTGWSLVVDRGAGFVRLHKIPASCRGTRRPTTTGRRGSFERRRYTLLCLVLAALDDSPRQTTLARVAQMVEELGAEDPELRPFDGTVQAERRALVDVLRWLVDLGVLRPREGDEERYVRSSTGDALYDVSDHMLGQMLAAPIPPSLAGDPEQMMAEPFARTEEGDRQRARWTVFRRLLDEPVVYYEDLDGAEYRWLDHSRGFVYQQLEQAVGLVVERRREGLAAVDPAGRLSDDLFPSGGSTVKHAALLLAELLVDHHRQQAGAAMGDDELARVVEELMADYGQRCRWKKQYMETDAGAARLAGDAAALLEGFDLIRRADGGWIARPALARFVPQAPGARSNADAR